MQPTDHPDDDESIEYGPSRSQQRRDALAVLALGEQLVALPESRLAALDLPDDVRAEVANVRRIRSHIARKRQLAYLAKLMRRHGEETFASARAALGEDRETKRQEQAVLHRTEALRERLLEEGDAALAEVITAHPDVDRQHLRALVRQARAEQQKNRPPRAYRELFRLLRSITADSDGA